MEKSIFTNKLVIRFAHNWGGILVHSSLQKLSKSFKTQNQLPPHIFCNVLPLSILPWRYVLDHCHTGRLLFSVPAEEGRLASKIFMAPKLNVSMLDCMDGVLCVILSISKRNAEYDTNMQTWRINLMPKSLIFHLWCHLTTALLPSLLWLI